MTLHTVYFSGKGTTAACAHCIKNAMGLKNKTHDWLHKPPTAEIALGKEDVLLLAMPVYAGFIPAICVPWVEKLRGDGTPAVIAAVYGNRHYDHALLQMKTLLEAQGFHVIAAGAFLAEHSEFKAEPFVLPGPVGACESGMVTLWPHRHDTDGFFICKLRKEE